MKNKKMHEIAITFDDLPGVGDISEIQKINADLLNTLNKWEITSVGFANERRSSLKDAKIHKDVMLSWVAHGQILGNHTASHYSLSNTDIEEYKKDVTRGDKLTKKIMNTAGHEYRWFRHPYLDIGSTQKTRENFESFLKEEGYTIAPVTIFVEDFNFNAELIKRPQDRNKIIEQYIHATRDAFIQYEELSLKLFGRNIKHVWLMHHNMINSYALDELLQMAVKIGYRFITLEEALEDKAYLEPDNFYTQKCLSWLTRWDMSRNTNNI